MQKERLQEGKHGRCGSREAEREGEGPEGVMEGETARSLPSRPLPAAPTRQCFSHGVSQATLSPLLAYACNSPKVQTACTYLSIFIQSVFLSPFVILHFYRSVTSHIFLLVCLNK